MSDRDIQGFWLWVYSLPIYVFDRLFIKPIVDIRNRGRRD